MITYYKKIDENTMKAIYEHETLQLEDFKKKFEKMYSNLAKTYGWNYRIHLYRWTNTVVKWRNKEYDGQTATLQVDFIDRNGSLIEVDESICSFFENVTYISFLFFRQRYRVYWNDEFNELWNEIERVVNVLNGPER